MLYTHTPVQKHAPSKGHAHAFKARHQHLVLRPRDRGQDKEDYLLQFFRSCRSADCSQSMHETICCTISRYINRLRVLQCNRPASVLFKKCQTVAVIDWKYVQILPQHIVSALTWGGLLKLYRSQSLPNTHMRRVRSRNSRSAMASPGTFWTYACLHKESNATQSTVRHDFPSFYRSYVSRIWFFLCIDGTRHVCECVYEKVSERNYSFFPDKTSDHHRNLSLL